MAQELTQRITIRLTPEQDAKLAQAAMAMGVTKVEAARRMISKSPDLRPLPPAQPVWNQRACSELNRIGVNLNQIAYELNARLRQEVQVEEIRSLDRALGQIVLATWRGPSACQQLIDAGLSALTQQRSGGGS